MKLGKLKYDIKALIRQNQLNWLPMRDQLKGYDRDKLRGDFRAGVNVALMVFLQGMAFAMIAGLPIEYGMFGSAIAGIAAGVFGSSRFVTQGPSNATAVITASSLAAIGMFDVHERAAAMPLFLLMIGFFLVVGALLRAANLVQYISRTVITGYITAAALMIIAGQLRHILGVDYTEYEYTRATTFFRNILYTFEHLPQLQHESCILAGATLAVYLVLRRFAPRLPNTALTLIILSLAAMALSYLVPLLPQAWNATRFWDASRVHMLTPVNLSGWPVGVPDISFEAIARLANAAMAVAMMCALEACSIGKNLAARSGERLDANQEVYSLGMINIAGSFFGGMPASGSLTRSQLAWDSGNRTTMAAMINGIIVIACIFAIGPLIGYIPQPALSMLVILIGFSLFTPHAIRLSLRATKGDAAVFLVTCTVGLLFPLDTAIYFGIGLSIILFLRKAASPELVEYGFNEGGVLAEIKDHNKRNTPEISIIHVEGELFFAAAEIFRDQIRRVCEDENLKIVIIKMRNARHLDATTVMAIEELLRFMRERDRVLLMSECRKGAIRVFKNSGLLETIGRQNVFPDSPGNPTHSTAKALKRAQQILGTNKADVKIYVSPSKKPQE